jgi:hypothetical protein
MCTLCIGLHNSEMYRSIYIKLLKALKYRNIGYRIPVHYRLHLKTNWPTTFRAWTKPLKQDTHTKHRISKRRITKHQMTKRQQDYS